SSGALPPLPPASPLPAFREGRATPPGLSPARRSAGAPASAPGPPTRWRGGCHPGPGTSDASALQTWSEARRAAACDVTRRHTVRQAPGTGTPPCLGGRAQGSGLSAAAALARGAHTPLAGTRDSPHALQRLSDWPGPGWLQGYPAQRHRDGHGAAPVTAG